jgi:hypothetical protein
MAAPITRSAVPCFNEVVRHGIAVLERCLTSAQGGDENLPILFSYRHLLEVLDGCGVLISEACEVPTMLALRSEFEALLSIKHLTQGDTVRRGYAWLVVDVHRRIHLRRMFDPETTEGREFLGEERRLFGRNRPIDIQVGELRASRQKLEDALATGRWSEAEREWQRVRSARKGKLPWYALFGGPPNLRGLARRHGFMYYYDVLYKDWSAKTHVQDLQHVIGANLHEIQVRRLRAVDELQTLAGLGALMGISASRLMLQHYRGEELTNGSFRSWYQTSVQGHIHKLVPYLKEKETGLTKA